jgi:hypothetical protein
MDNDWSGVYRDKWSYVGWTTAEVEFKVELPMS